MDKQGKIVEYAGYLLPVLYETTGVKAEHLKVRSDCGMFDVSHMGQVFIYGKDRVKFIELLTPVDMEGLKDHQASLSVILNENGGIIDDTVITKLPERIGMVLNGACKHKDLAHIKKVIDANPKLKVSLVHEVEKSLIALQGPKAAQILSKFAKFDLSKVPFMQACPEPVVIAGSVCEVTRCGYTGEDGFEISIHNANNGAQKVAEELVKGGGITLAGLGCRDSLRVEAGLCLYGNDIDENRSIVEAGLLWVFSKNRRDKISKYATETSHKKSEDDPRFIGASRVMREIVAKPEFKRSGFLIHGAPAREHVKLFDEAGKTQVGEITSGTFSPVLNAPVAMGYIQRDYKIGQKVKAQVRNKMVDAEVSKMPFVAPNYYRLP